MKHGENVTVWSVRRRSNREAGRWLFGSDRNARMHVEMNATGRLQWSHPSESKIVASDGKGTWVIVKKTIQDAVGLILADHTEQTQ